MNRSLAAKHDRAIKQKRELGRKLSAQFETTHPEVHAKPVLRDVALLADKLIHDGATTAKVTIVRQMPVDIYHGNRKMVKYRVTKPKPVQAHSFVDFAPTLVKRADMRGGTRCL